MNNISYEDYLELCEEMDALNLPVVVNWQRHYNQLKKMQEEEQKDE